MHVPQLLDSLGFREHVEIIEWPLPESVELNWIVPQLHLRRGSLFRSAQESLGDALLEGLHDY